MINYQVGDKFHFPSWKNKARSEVYLLINIDTDVGNDEIYQLKFHGCLPESSPERLTHHKSDIYVSRTTLDFATIHIKKQSILRII